MIESRQFIVTALPAEAKPVIEYYRLKKRQNESAFPIFERDALSLIVSGLGKIAAATATAYVYAASGQPNFSSWLNIGIAGHRNLPIGQAVLAHKIVNTEAGTAVYPTFLEASPCPRAALISVDQPADQYPDNALVDMEAAGFYDAATRFSSSELIHSLKVVSDNCAHPAEMVNAAHASTLIAEHANTIDQVMTQQRTLLDELCAIHQPPEQYAPIMHRWRFSHSQQFQLREMLRRWSVLRDGQQPSMHDLEHCTSGKQVIQWLNAQLDVGTSMPS